MFDFSLKNIIISDIFCLIFVLMMEMPAIQFIPREGLKSLYFSKGWIIVWSRSVLILTKRTAKNYLKLIFFTLQCSASLHIK